MTPLLRSLGRTIAAACVIGTATFCLVSANEDNNYSCCGNISAPGAERCRYTDRDVKCQYDSTCSSDTGYTMCCESSCVKLLDM